MNEQEQVREIEIDMETAKKTIALEEAMSRLYKDKDFKAVILDGYFKEEASRTVMLKAEPNMQDEIRQKALDNIITGIGSLRQYFRKVYQVAQMSLKSLEDQQQAREEILAEDLQDGDL